MALKSEFHYKMISVAGHNIITPLGVGSTSCFEAILSGMSGLRSDQKPWPSVEPVCASMFRSTDDYTVLCPAMPSEATDFERLAVASVAGALQTAPAVDPSSPSTLFILSTTKGNIKLIEDNPTDARIPLLHSARIISRTFGNPNPPLVVSNACISGVAAQIAAAQIISGTSCYTDIIVVGAELLSRFIVAGFQAFKALSDTPCRPFDERREGLNLGEGAATIILTNRPIEAEWSYRSGAIANDANHISGPSRTGEGSYRALTQATAGLCPADIGFINAHGTATLYNDEMESIAIERAGLSSVPVNSLKGYLGHTLGAAGVIETIISMCAAERGIIIPTAGFQNPGTSRPLNVSNTLRHDAITRFVKLISGFGGVNGALVYERRLHV